MGLIEDNARVEIEELVIKLNKGAPADWVAPAREPRRVPRPSYVLRIDGVAPYSIVVVVQTGTDGVTLGTVSVPEHDDLPEFHEGPFPVQKALRIADRWAYRYGHEEVTVDIESSQLWDKAWGDLEMPTEGHYSLSTSIASASK